MNWTWHLLVKVFYLVFGGVALFGSFGGLIFFPLSAIFADPDNELSTGMVLQMALVGAGWFAVYCGLAWLHRWGIGVWPFPMTYFIHWMKKVRPGN